MSHNIFATLADTFDSFLASCGKIWDGWGANNKQLMQVVDRMVDLSLSFWRQEPENMAGWMEHNARIMLQNPYLWWPTVCLALVAFFMNPMISIAILVAAVVFGGAIPAAIPFLAALVLFMGMYKRGWIGRLVVFALAIIAMVMLLDGVVGVVWPFVLAAPLVMFFNPKGMGMTVITILVAMGLWLLSTSAQLPLLLVEFWAGLCWLYLKK